MWTTGMHGYSRFSHQLNFQLTKADFPPCCEPLMPLVAVYDSGFLCSLRLPSWSCCLIRASSSQEEEGGLLGQVWLQLCLWTASGQGRVCALSVQSMNGTCTRVAARGKLWACFHCYFLDCHIEEGFLPWIPCWHLLAWVYAFLLAEPGSYLRVKIQAKSNLA